MSHRSRAAAVIARRQVFEALISPGIYVALGVGLFLGYALVRGFAAAIDSSGFNYQLAPLYDIIGRTLEGAFGRTFVDALFAEGPFFFAFVISFAPVFLYLAASSVFKFGLERSAGAVELLAYGPADGTSYFIASYVKDIFLTVLAALILLAFMAAAAAVYNFVVSPQFLFSVLVMLFLSFAVAAYGILASMLAGNASSALALFIGILLLFLVILAGSFTIVSSYVRSLSSVIAWVANWISPFYYWNLTLQALAVGNSLGYAGGLALLAVLSGLILLASHLVIAQRGVRA